jgi:hypothetical protein
MPRKGRSNEEIVHALHQVEGGEKVAEVCRRLGGQRADGSTAGRNSLPASGTRRCASSGRCGVLDFLIAWLQALRWQRLPEMERLGDFPLTHIDGIAAYCDHDVRFGVVESLNTTIKTVLRRARGMRDEGMLLLKLKWATAHPIRSARDVMRFPIGHSVCSNR